jgi:dCMP deaminase
MKRENYISWGDFFMGVAVLAAQRSKDPNTQVGSCAVNSKNRIIGVGYNGMPNGCSDDILPWGKGKKSSDSKYPVVVHSEVNTILNSLSLSELNEATLYCTLFPCNECAKLIIQSGIKKVIFLSDKYDGDEYNLIAKRLFNMAGVQYEKFKSELGSINLDLK